MIAVREGIWNRQEKGLLSTIAVQSESGNTGHIDGAAAAKHGIKNIILRAENTACLYVDGDLAVRQLLYLGLKISCHLAYDGIQRVNLCVYQSYLRHISCVVSAAGS